MPHLFPIGTMTDRHMIQVEKKKRPLVGNCECTEQYHECSFLLFILSICAIQYGSPPATYGSSNLK